MYVSIDRENLKFLHKHPDLHVVCNLAWIETPHVALSVTPYDHNSFLRECTDMELKILYRNTTGVDHTGFGGDALRAILAELAERLPVSDVNAFEVERQAAILEDGNHDRYKYVKGSTRPAKQGELFEPEALKAVRSDNEEVIAAAARLRPTQPRATATHTPAPASAQPRPARPTAAPRTPGAPRQGGVREKIWEVADRMWDEAGKPTEKSTVLALRKNIMNALEQDGVKRTSSSNELGNWQKARIA